MIIRHLGRTIETSDFDGVHDMKLIEKVRNGFYKEDRDKALKQLRQVLSHKTFAINHIYAYYFERVANDGISKAKWSINEMLDSDDLVQLFINRTNKNDSVFTSKDLIINFKTAIRLGGFGIANKMSNFPLKECVNVLDDYSHYTNTYLDPSCGWGVRMIASAILRLDYTGFEVNSNLVIKLEELGRDIQSISPSFKFNIYKQGFQEFVPDLVNRFGVAFTSPPYFTLEKYGNNDFEKKSSINGSYQEWLDRFVHPLMHNLNSYTEEDATIMINVKNYDSYNLVHDFIKIAWSNGLIYQGYLMLNNSKRQNGSGEVDNSEKILKFKRKIV